MCHVLFISYLYISFALLTCDFPLCILLISGIFKNLHYFSPTLNWFGLGFILLFLFVFSSLNNYFTFFIYFFWKMQIFKTINYIWEKMDFVHLDVHIAIMISLSTSHCVLNLYLTKWWYSSIFPFHWILGS